jgi:hypothetical protein
MSALKFIQLVARKKAAEQGGKGITTIGNRMLAEAKTGEIAETFRLSGLTPDKWDQFIKSEADVLKHLNQIEAINKQRTAQETLASGLGKYFKKEGEVVEFPRDKITDWTKARPTPDKNFIPMRADQYRDVFGKSPDLKKVKKTEAQIKKELEKQNKESIKRFKDKMKDPEDFAGGGIAGMLGERIGFQGGGADMGTVHGDTRRATAKSVQVSPTGRVTTSTTRGPDPVNDRASSDQNAAHMIATAEARRPKRTISGTINKVLNNPFVRTYAAWGSGGISETLRQAILAKRLYDTRNILDDEAIEEEITSIPIEGGIVPPLQFAGGGIAGMLGEPTYQDDNHRVPYDSGNMVLPKEKPFQGLFHTEVGGPVITKDDSEFEAVVDRWSQFARQKGEGPEGVERNKSFALENIVRIGRELGYEDDEIKEIILRINKAAGGRVPFSKGKLAAGLEAALKEIMEKFGKRSITTASKLERPLKAIEKEKTKKMFDDFTNKINTQEALSKGSKKMAGPIKNVNKKPYDMQPSSTDHTTWLQQEKFFDPKALDMYGNKVPANWIEVEKKAAQKLIDDLGPLNVSPNHPNYKDMKAIRQSAKDRLSSIKVTEALGGNIQMHDWLRMNRKNIKMSDYIRKEGAPVVKDELSGIKLAHIQRKLSPADELKAEFPGISDDLINKILTDDNPQRIAEAKAAMKEALKMQEKGMNVDEIIDIFKKQGKKPTKHASGGLAGMLGE